MVNTLFYFTVKYAYLIYGSHKTALMVLVGRLMPWDNLIFRTYILLCTKPLLYKF